MVYKTFFFITDNLLASRSCWKGLPGTNTLAYHVSGREKFHNVDSSVKLFVLPVDVLLKNSIALSYFIDYMTTIGCQAYLFFYLNVEGWKVSEDKPHPLKMT
jgi:hypothetical protein